MKISQRLYLTVLPAILGVVTVAALAYWGRYAYTVPHLVLIIAAIASVGSLVLAWVNTRYVAQRIERLAGPVAADTSHAPLRGVADAFAPRAVHAPPDELDTIEGVVDHLSSAVVGAQASRTEQEREADRRVHEYAEMLASVAAAAAARLEEVRLPLHILLENHFGDLNENQEEMLGAARNAAEAVDADVVALGQLAELDLGYRELRRDRLLPGDLIRALLHTLQASAEHAGATLHTDIEPFVPAIHVDQPRVQDALATVLGDAIRGATQGTDLRLTLTNDGGTAVIRLRGVQPTTETIRGALATRLLLANGGNLVRQDDTITVRFTNDRD